MRYADGDYVKVTSSGPRFGQKGYVMRVTQQTRGEMKRIYWVRFGTETQAFDADSLAFAGRFFNQAGEAPSPAPATPSESDPR